MITEIFMPKNGMDMTEGTIVKWLKNVGDPVKADEPVMEIETDKITMESEAPGSGVLLKKLYEDGNTVPVLTVIGYIGQPGDALPDGTAADSPAPGISAAASAVPAEAVPAPAAPAAAVPVADPDHIAATPHARALAGDKGIALATVAPTGRDGQVTAKDVEAAANSTPLARKIAADRGRQLNTIAGTGFGGKVTAEDLEAEMAAALQEIEEVVERRKLTSMRKVIARRMLQSRLEIPDVTVEVQADVTDLMALRARFNEGRESRVSVNDFILKAVAIATRENERIRMQFADTDYLLSNQVNIGMAVSISDGLLVPVIRNADRLDLLEISAESKRVAKAARDGKLKKEDLGGASISISNLGMFGVHSFTSIINQPESAILGVASAEDVLTLNTQRQAIEVRKKMMLMINFDHRILNGTEGVTYLNRIKELLENPDQLLP